MPEIHSKQPGSTYSTCGPFIKNKERTNKAFEIACDTKYDDYQRGLALMVQMFFDKKSSGGAIKETINLKMNFTGRLLEKFFIFQRQYLGC